MYNLKRLLLEVNTKIDRKKPFSLSPSDPYMYYWDTTEGGVWMSKKKNAPADEPWFNLKLTLSPSDYSISNKKLGANPLANTAYQLDASGETTDYSSSNDAAALDAQKQTDALNKRLKAYNADFGLDNKKIDVSQLKPIEAGTTSNFNPKILTKLPNGWMQIEIPWGTSNKKTKFWTRSKWFTNGSYNYKNGKRSYKVYWMSPK